MSGQGSIRRLSVNADGVVSGLNVIGIHGFISDDNTPAVREPVYQTVDGRLARIVQVDKEANRWVEVEVAATILGDAKLPGDGTRVGSWRARLGYDVVAVVSGDERLNGGKIADKATRLEVAQLFQWIGGGGFTCPALVSLVNCRDYIWYASADDVADLFHAIRKVAAMGMIDQVLRPTRTMKESLERSSWWLSRAAIYDNDSMCLAVAGLKLTGVDCWSEVLKCGLPSCTDEERATGLMKAEAFLEYLSKITR